jgi:hypothetical protein
MLHPARTPSLPTVKMCKQAPGDDQVTYDKSYDALLRHHNKKLDAPWKAQGVSHIPWSPLSASRTHPTASTTIITAVLDGGLAGFNSNRQRTAPRMRWPGQNTTHGHTGNAQVALFTWPHRVGMSKICWQDKKFESLISRPASYKMLSARFELAIFRVSGERIDQLSHESEPHD